MLATLRALGIKNKLEASAAGTLASAFEASGEEGCSKAATAVRKSALTACVLISGTVCSSSTRGVRRLQDIAVARLPTLLPWMAVNCRKTTLVTAICIFSSAAPCMNTR